MTDEKHPLWTHILLAVLIASLFAAVPFWTHGLTSGQATAIATVIFPLIIAAYVYIMRRAVKSGKTATLSERKKIESPSYSRLVAAPKRPIKVFCGPQVYDTSIGISHGPSREGLESIC